MNFWWGKIIFGLIGYYLAGLTGMMLGAILGHTIDQTAQNLLFTSYPFSRLARIRTVYFQSIFRIMGYIAKSDGRVSANEIRVAEQVMAKMQLDATRRLEAIALFTEGKQPYFNLAQQLAELSHVCGGKQSLLSMFFEIQLQVAYADGYVIEAKQQIIQTIYQTLGFGPVYTGFYRHWQQQHSAGNQSKQPPPKQTTTTLTQAYATLGVTAAASHAEIKKAYRRLMSKNHPDKLIAKGLSESMLKLATEKTQRIMAAYEQICAARGM